MDPPLSTHWPLIALTVAVPALLLCGLVLLWLLPAAVSRDRSNRLACFVVWSAVVVAVVELLFLLPGWPLSGSMLPAFLQQAIAKLPGTTENAFGVVTLFCWLPAAGTSLPEPLAVQLQLAVLPLLCSVVLLVSAAAWCSGYSSCAGRHSPMGALGLCLCCILSLFSVDLLPAVLFWLAAVSCCGVPPENADAVDATAESAATGGPRVRLWFGDLLLVAGGLSLSFGSASAGWTAVAWLAVLAGVGLRCGLLPCVAWSWRAGGMSTTAVAWAAGAGVLPAGLILLFRLASVAGPVLSPAVRQSVVWWGLISAAVCAGLCANASNPAVLAGRSARAVLCTTLAAVAAGTTAALQAGLLLLLAGGLSLVLAASVIEGLPTASRAALSAGEHLRQRTAGGILLASLTLVLLPGGLCGWNAVAAEFRNLQIGPAAWLLPVTQLLLGFGWVRWWLLQTAAGNAAPGGPSARTLSVSQPVLAVALLWLAWGTAAETGPVSRLLAAAVASTKTGATAIPAAAIPVSTVDADLGLLLVLFGGAGGWFAAVRRRGLRPTRDGQTSKKSGPFLPALRALACGLFRLSAWFDETVPAKLAVLLRRRVPLARDAIIASLPASPAFSTLAVLLAVATILWVVMVW